jgi:hypothetical protein
MSPNSKAKLTRDTALLWQYQKLIMACSHFDDLARLDARSFIITLNVKDGKQAKLRKLIYFKLVKAFCGKTYAVGSSRPAFVIDDDIAGTKWGKGRNENHHFHALLVLPKLQNQDEMIAQDMELKLACQLEKLYGVLDVHVERYYFGNSLAEVMKYNAKLIDCPWLDPSDGLLALGSGVYPWEFDQGSKTLTRAAKAKRLETTAKLLANFKSDASAFFSSEYLHHFGEEITQVTRHFSSVWAAQYPELWKAATHARKRAKPGLRLVKSGEIEGTPYPVAA